MHNPEKGEEACLGRPEVLLRSILGKKETKVVSLEERPCVGPESREAIPKALCLCVFFCPFQENIKKFLVFREDFPRNYILQSQQWPRRRMEKP